MREDTNRAGRVIDDVRRGPDARRRGAEEIRWAPRVPRHTIRRLYQSDAAGRLDKKLVDEVAYAFHARCRSIITVTEAQQGRVACPRCEAIIQRKGGDKDEDLRCDACGWHTTWGAYLRTYQRKQLSGGSAIDAFTEYVERLPAARTPVARMLLVDWLIHAVHEPMVKEPESWRGRIAAVNLISGNMHQVLALLTELACGPGSTPQVRARETAWRDETMPHLWGIERVLARQGHSQDRSAGTAQPTPTSKEHEP